MHMKTIGGDGVKKEKLDLVVESNASYTRPKKSQAISNDPGQNTWYYLGFVGDIGFTIAIPIAGGAIAGKYLDGVWGTYPKATLLFLVVGIVLSLIGFIHTVSEIIKRKH